MRVSTKSYFVFSLVVTAVVTILSEWMQMKGIANFPAGFRHVVITVLFFTNWLIYGRRIKKSRYIQLAVVMLVYLIIAYYYNPISSYNYLLGSVFTFMFMFVFIFSVNTKVDIQIVFGVFQKLLWAIIVIALFSVFEGILARTTLRYSPGLFRETGALASFLNIGSIISLSLYIYTKKRRYLIIAMVLSFLVLTTTLKKSIISNIVVWAFYGFTGNILTKKIKIYFGIGLMLIVGIYLFKDEFLDDYERNYIYYERVGPDKHVRSAMYLAAYNIALDNFPFGSGLGTFASLSSIIGRYSSVHFKYGVAYIGSNSPEDVARGHHTLLDTFWPHILGELGVIGMGLFLLIWFYPLIKSYPLLKNQDIPDAIRSFAFYIILINLVMSLEGFALYTPEIPTFVYFHAGMSGFCFFHITTYKIYSITRTSAM